MLLCSFTKYLQLRGALESLIVFFVLFFFVSSGANGLNSTTASLRSYSPSVSIYNGFVYGRSIVRDQSTGLPLWAEYNEQGGYTQMDDVDLQIASRSNIVSGSSLRTMKAAYSGFKDRYSGDIEFYSKADYHALMNGGLQNYEGKSISGLPALGARDHFIALPAKSKRFEQNGSLIEYIAFPFNVESDNRDLANVKSAMIDDQGEIHKTSPLRIGHLTAFYTQNGSAPPSATEYESQDGWTKNLFINGYEVLDPLSGIRITASNGMSLDKETYSAADGTYRIELRFGCPGGYFQVTTYLDAHLNYDMFTPRGTANMPYYLTRTPIDNCLGFIDPHTGVGMSNIDATRINFQVGLSILTGTAVLKNVEITETEPTSYQAEQSPEEQRNIYGDFNFDKKEDLAIRGFKTESGFAQNINGDLMAIYLDGETDGKEPDMYRTLDYAKHLSHQGLVKTINKEDLRDTDLFAFRESTGELITERQGIPEQRLNAIGGPNEGLTKNNEFTYTFAIRSPEDITSIHAKRHAGWEAWQADNKMNPNLHSRQSDHLRIGEEIRIVAINRSTGYIGSVITKLQPSVDEETGADGVTVHVDKIEMAPPNLKIWAIRETELHGAEDDDVQYTISNEGAGTTEDKIISVYTEWLDAKGYPLPTALKDKGYTGRLVHVASADELQPYPSRVKEFPINPGLNRHTLKFPEDEIDKQHFYVQVNGKSQADENDFSTGNHTGVLRHRPNKYVPVKVPLYNEQAHLDANKASDDTIAPVFSWVYRPEYSYSLVELEVQSILRHTQDAEKIELVESDDPVIAYSDKLVEVFFELSNSEFDRITPIDGEQEFIFALGEDEIKVTVDQGDPTKQHIKFENIEHLEKLKEEDFLSLKLYLNSDAQNILWQWAFHTLDIDIDSDNNNDLEGPDRSPEEEAIEHLEGYSGKMIHLNDGDYNDNDIPDFAEFTYRNDQDQKVSVPFTPFMIEIPEHVKLATAKLTITYSASDPEAVEKENLGTAEDPDWEYTPAPGYQRLWLKNGDEDRVGTPIENGGDFINTEYAYFLADLGFSSQERVKTFYIEGISPSEAGQATIELELRYDDQ